MKGPFALGVVAAALAAVVAPACAGTDTEPASPEAAAAPLTRLTVKTWLPGDVPGDTYTLTCGPARITGLPPGRLRPLEACGALGQIGDRIYRRSLSVTRTGCAYVQEPPRAELVGHRRGRSVRTSVSIGPCERLLVPRAALDRIVAWGQADR